MKVLKTLNAFDKKATLWIHRKIGKNSHPTISNMPYYLGLLPYELYVLPGMFIAILVMLYYQSFHPVQFHLLPHWFAFSLASYIKMEISRKRPGCSDKRMSSRIRPNHCKGSTAFKSFPSGHTIIAFSLATSLQMYLNDPTYPETTKVFLGIPFGKYRHWTITVGYLVAVMISLHRISYGYHYISDVIVGAVLGVMVGFASYTICNVPRTIYLTDNPKKREWLVIRVVLSIIFVFALVHFFLYKFSDLSSLKH